MMKKIALLATWIAPWLLLAVAGRSQPNNGARPPAPTNDKRYTYAREQARVRSLILKKFVRPVAEEALYEAAIQGMVDALDDPYTEYINEEKYAWLTKGSDDYVGIGVTILIDRRGALQIVSTREGSPADRAGLMSGDSIVAIDGFRNRNMKLLDAARRIKGKKGEQVALTVLRRRGAQEETVEETIAVVRDRIAQSSVQGARLLDKEAGIGYLRISAFEEDTPRDVAAALRGLVRRGARALILDLRNNGGGEFDAGRRVADLFVSEGILVSTVGRGDRAADQFIKVYKASESASVVEDDFPLVLLINGGSVSAAEIVAGAIQDLERGQLVGTPTFGKGSVQQIVPIGTEAKTALRLTTAHWLRPSGSRTTPSNPVKPDREVPIAGAVWKELIRKRLQGDAYKRPETMDEDPVDTQLLEAIELLKTWE